MTGRVIASDGTPLAGVDVEASNKGCLPKVGADDGFNSREMGRCDRTSTDALGRYSLQMPRYAESASITAVADSRLRQTLPWGSELDHVNFTLEPGLEVSGVVTDGRGIPLDDVALTTTEGSETWSTPSGHFHFESVQRGTELTATHRDFAQLTTRITAPDSAMRLTLGEGVSLRVTLRGAESCEGGAEVRALGHSAAEPDGGVFVITGLPADRSLEVEALCFVDHELIVARKVVEPPLADSVTLDIPKLRHVRIEVTDGVGQPVSGRRFLLVSASPLVKVLQTDERGEMSAAFPSGPGKWQLTLLEPRPGEVWMTAQGTLDEQELLRLTLVERREPPR